MGKEKKEPKSSKKNVSTGRKEYRVSKEIMEKFNEKGARELVFHRTTSMFFSHKKALKLARDIVKLGNDGWTMIRELYPELKHKRIRYDNMGFVYEIDED